MKRGRSDTTAVPRLAPVAVEILESLYQHRLLSTLQIHDLHTPDASQRWTQQLLATARRAGLAAVTRRPGGLGLWYLTESGVEAVELIGNRVEPRRKLIRPEQAAGPLQAHTLAVNDVGIAFVKAARQRGHECGAFSWRHEIAHPIGRAPGRRRDELVIADAVLAYQLDTSDASTQFHYAFIELDRSTIPVEHLAAKLARYARLYRHASTGVGAEPARRLWQRSYPTFPSVIAVLAGDGPRSRLERRRATVLALCQEDEALMTTRIVVAACLAQELADPGLFAPIFHFATPSHAPAPWPLISWSPSQQR